MVPWSLFWEHNYFAAAWPALRPFLLSNFVRGAISGVGIVNLYAAFADLVVVFGRQDPGAPAERH